jgi:hypothetical protein
MQPFPDGFHTWTEKAQKRWRERARKRLREDTALLWQPLPGPLQVRPPWRTHEQTTLQTATAAAGTANAAAEDDEDFGHAADFGASMGARWDPIAIETEDEDNAGTPAEIATTPTDIWATATADTAADVGASAAPGKGTAHHVDEESQLLPELVPELGPELVEPEVPQLPPRRPEVLEFPPGLEEAPTRMAKAMPRWSVPRRRALQIDIVTWGRKLMQAPCCDRSWCCLKFYDPEHTPCCGKNGVVQLRLMENHGAKAMIEEFHAVVGRAMTSGVERLKCGFFCNKGRHRSVAMAELVHGVLKVRGFETTIQHLTLEDCGCPDEDCRVLQSMPRLAAVHEFRGRQLHREQAQDLAEHIWDRAALR